MNFYLLKGIVYPKMKFHLLTTHPDVDGGSSDIFFSTQWESVVAKDSSIKKTTDKKYNMLQYCSCSVIQMSGTLGSLIFVKTMMLTLYFPGGNTEAGSCELLRACRALLACKLLGASMNVVPDRGG